MRFEPLPNAALGPFVAVAALIGRRAGGLAALGAATALILVFDNPDPSVLDLTLFVGKWLIVVAVADVAHDLWLRAAEQERVRAEQARLAQQRLELALESGAIGTFEVDLFSNDIRLNEKHREIFGWTADQRVTTEPSGLPGRRGGSRGAARGAGARVERERSVFTRSIRIRRANDGALRCIETRGEVCFENGAAVRVLGATRDVTDEMEAAASLEERARLAEQDRVRAEELRREQQRLQLALEAGAIGTFEADLARDEIRLNEKLRAIWGWPGDAPVKPGDLDALVVEEDNAARDAARARARMDEGATARGFASAAPATARCAGSTRAARSISMAMRSRVLGVTRDITDESGGRRRAGGKGAPRRTADLLTEALPGVIYSYVSSLARRDFFVYALAEHAELLGDFAPKPFPGLDRLKARLHAGETSGLIAAIEARREFGAWRGCSAMPTRREARSGSRAISQPMPRDDGARSGMAISRT